ncbi:MAG: hypothetical protein ACI9MC_002650 [Kiritimatiellia bacterium]|jgi:hypothetical protein
MRYFLLSALSLSACSDSHLRVQVTPPGVPPECEIEVPTTDQVAPIDTCVDDPGSFNPVVEWQAGKGKSCQSAPAVADLDGDGKPEVIANFTGLVPTGGGSIYVMSGDGGQVLWQRDVNLGYGAGLTIGDVDNDGKPEILGVRAYGSQLPLFGVTEYTVAAWSAEGTLLWESIRYDALDFDYATGIVLSDMDHDGNTEIIAGRVILNKDGTERGKGAYGKGSYGVTPGFFGNPPFSESSLPAVTDIDLDGIEEVIVGNAMYSPDGEMIWYSASAEDGMIAIANLDDDPEGEIIASSFDTVRAMDTNGLVLWGPITLPGANIVSAAAIADLDGDDKPEIVVAGGSAIYALRADGSTLWSSPVTDESGASGASIFDFEGDGQLEVVYFDEVQMIAYDGATGAVKFLSTEHNSGTMMDYPVIADVDGDGQAEILVSHMGYSSALSVYGDADGSWAPARSLWNQHHYYIDNINDDLSIPADAEPNFTTHNTWHSAVDPTRLREGLKELEVVVMDVCDVACDEGVFYLLARVVNRSVSDLPPGIQVTAYAVTSEGTRALQTLATVETAQSGTIGEVITFELSADDVRGVDSIRVVIDDDGNGVGQYLECDELNNADAYSDATCP